MFLNANNLVNKLKWIIILGVFILTNPVICANAAPRLQDVGDKLVIVIDPGHGGENEGTKSGKTVEKEMDLVTAKAMYNELLKYDNVEVYLTRTEDVPVGLEERAEFAKSVDADFLFSIHYNASENHTMYGTEVWVSCDPAYNSFGYQFGYMQIQEMAEFNLFVRGVKTRIGSDGDYYGVIRHCVNREIPAVIIEHCYVDHERDMDACDSEEDWIAFGEADARAVAKYFGLKSAVLGVDYSKEADNLPEVQGNMLVKSTMPDETPPDVCMLELLEADYNTGEISLQVTATDYDTPLIYYEYSLDGGASYSGLQPWPEVDVMAGTFKDTFQFTVQVESGLQPEPVVRVYNLFDLDTESNHIPMLQAFYYDEESTKKEADTQEYTPIQPHRPTAGTTTFVPAMAEVVEEKEEEVSILTFLKLCLFFVILLFAVVLISQSISYRKRKRLRRRRIREMEERIYRGQE